MKRDYGMRSDISVTTGYKYSRHIKLLLEYFDNY